jgi:hypothetical protein
MARGRFLWDEEMQTWRPAHEVVAKRRASQPDNSSLFPCPMVIGAMPEIRSPIDGRFYSDKSSYYRHVERADCSIVGFEKNWDEQVKRPLYDERAHEADVVADVKKSIETLKSGTAEPINHAS